MAAASLPELQARFAAALIDPDLPPPAGLASATGRARPDEKRFAVYRNNVVVSLSRALRDAYPALRSILGDAFFADMAGVYVRRHPPRRPMLIDYGAELPQFLENFEPARPHPYLPDVARLERARLEAYHAADAPFLAPADIAALAPESLAGLSLRPHPAARLLASRFPIVTVWMMNSGLAEPAPVDFSSAETALVTRPGLNVELRRLRPGGHAFLSALFAGKSLGAAAARAAAEPNFDLAANLADALGAGAFLPLEKIASTLRPS
ncbi:HvfC/BufC N-terminal domain-containing protein [Afifella pfennigii]|uniref:HvfC/BufC N-terminal domain-containing protein n=1 Tax=Afifella pfennigii TaxID=209897 RepID=UPI00047DB311|nr:DNA-binding domain-containing protein [Afifella pfennigii]